MLGCIESLLRLRANKITRTLPTWPNSDIGVVLYPLLPKTISRHISHAALTSELGNVAWFNLMDDRRAPEKRARVYRPEKRARVYRIGTEVVGRPPRLRAGFGVTGLFIHLRRAFLAAGNSATLSTGLTMRSICTASAS